MKLICGGEPGKIEQVIQEKTILCETASIARPARLFASCPVAAGGFTLIELIIVVVIVAVLAALVFAGGRKAIGRANAAQCASNLRQIGIGMQLYSIDNNGRLPSNIGATWDMQIMGYLDKSGYHFAGVSPSVGLNKATPSAAAKLFKCPEDRRSHSSEKYPRSYALASWVVNWDGWHYSASLPANVGIRIQQLQAPARSAVLFEAPIPAPIAGTGNILGSGNFCCFPVFYDESPSKIHSSMANMLFADWHVELIPRDKTPDGGTLAARYFPPESELCRAAGGPIPQ